MERSIPGDMNTSDPINNPKYNSQLFHSDEVFSKIHRLQFITKSH